MRIPPLMIKFPIELIDLSPENLAKPRHQRRLLYTTYVELVNLSHEALEYAKKRAATP